MLSPFRHHLLLLAAALGTLGLTPAAQAGDLNLNKSETSMLVSTVSAMLVLSSPVYLSAFVADKAGDASATSDKRGRDGQRLTAGPLPDMRVIAIEQTLDGGRSVSLKDPDNTENYATLQWPQREDNPAANFKIGERVAFTPSAQRSGWMLRAEDGAVLTFVPTGEIAAEAHSAKL